MDVNPTTKKIFAKLKAKVEEFHILLSHTDLEELESDDFDEFMEMTDSIFLISESLAEHLDNINSEDDEDN